MGQLFSTFCQWMDRAVVTIFSNPICWVESMMGSVVSYYVDLKRAICGEENKVQVCYTKDEIIQQMQDNKQMTSAHKETAINVIKNTNFCAKCGQSISKVCIKCDPRGTQCNRAGCCPHLNYIPESEFRSS